MDYTWHAMPQQQHQYGRGTNPGRGGTGPGGRDPGFDQPGGSFEGTGPDPSQTARDWRARQTKTAGRQAQLDRMMSAQHRTRMARGQINPYSGLSALSEMERDYERQTQETKVERMGMLTGIFGALAGAMIGLPGLGALGKAIGGGRKAERMDAAMEAYDETGTLTERGMFGLGVAGPTDRSQRGEGSDPPGPVKPPKQADKPEEPPEPLPDPYDQFWLEQFGIDPNDPRLRDPSFDPGSPGRPSASASRRRLDLQGPGGNATLAYMQQVGRDIERSRGRRAMAGPR